MAGQEPEHVAFFLPGESPAAYDAVDPDRDWRLFGTGWHVWIVQTYLRLKRLGLPVLLSSEPPTSGMVVVMGRHLPALLAAQPLVSKVLPVVIRGDALHRAYGSPEVVQNMSSADDAGRFFIPHWPQPALIPRDPSRSDAIRTATFKGATPELSDLFKGPAWEAVLAEHRLEWRADAVVWREYKTTFEEAAWNDYSDIDLVIAVRGGGLERSLRKPASKLVNAWLAGVPAILGPEVAYRELRRSDLDYIEASTLEEISAAIAKLKAEPALYRAMIDNGLRRGADFTAERTAERWRELLFRQIPGSYPAGVARAPRTASVAMRFRARQAARRLLGRDAT